LLALLCTSQQISDLQGTVNQRTSEAVMKTFYPYISKTSFLVTKAKALVVLIATLTSSSWPASLPSLPPVLHAGFQAAYSAYNSHFRNNASYNN